MDCGLPLTGRRLIVRERRINPMRRHHHSGRLDMRRRMTWFLLVVIVGAGTHGSSLQATPANRGFSAKTLAMSTFDPLDVNLHTIPADVWQARLKTRGLSDLYVQSNAWQPGGSTGWHTHPGPSLVIVTAGTLTAYDGDDPTCAPHVYSALLGFPNSFVDPGGGHVHLVRNEDATAVATAIAVQLIPQAAARRIDAPATGNCPSSIF
jgi:hypothetical protein